MRSHLLPSVVLVALLGTGLWAWSHGLHGPYHFDDRVTPLNDPASQSLAARRHNAGQTGKRAWLHLGGEDYVSLPAEAPA